MGGSIEPQPLVVPDETWTYVAFPGTACGNGTEAGIAVNPTPASDKLLIYFQGGGACWDQLTCALAQTAVHVMDVGPLTQATFDEEVANNAGYQQLFDRANPTNPFADYDWVFVPYCTGDVFGGTRVATYGNATVHHKGYDNYTAFLGSIALTFPNTTNVVVSGSSAGGFGALLNFGRTADAFPTAQQDLIDDCGPPVPPPFLEEPLEQTFRTAWGIALPAGCPDCVNDLDAVFPYYDANYPNARMSLLAYTQDATIRQFFSLTAAEMQAGTYALADRMAPLPHARWFVVDATSHVMLDDAASLVGPSGVTLIDWVNQQLTRDAAWTSTDPRTLP